MNLQRIMIPSAFCLIIAGGITHGWMTHRWGENVAVKDAVVLLDAVPAAVGDWVAEDFPLSEAEVEIGGIQGYVRREYTNVVTGARVHFLLMCGAAGPISLHPPTVCFSGQGYSVAGHQSQIRVDHQAADHSTCRHVFQQADFGNSAIDDPTLTRLYWAWSTNGEWQAPANPRVHFSGEPALFKLYVSEQWVPQASVRDTGVARMFMDEMLPHVRMALQTSASQERD